ncbi:MAG: hypothetical protein ACLTWK_00200 [Eisenbergiella sp.]
MDMMKKPSNLDTVAAMSFIAALAVLYLFRADGVIPAGIMFCISTIIMFLE